MVCLLLACDENRQLTRPQAMGVQLICRSVRLLGDSLLSDEGVSTIYNTTNPSTASLVSALFARRPWLLPIRLFFTEPIVFLTSTMAATVSAIIYVFPEAFPVVFADAFNFNQRQCSLVNLAISFGVLFTIIPRLYDIRVSNHCRRNNIVAQPEDKIFGFLVAAPILAAAFWWFSLTIPPLVKGLSPWIPIASLSLVGFSVVELDTVLAGYLTDTYTSHAASANASLSFLRAVLSGILPLFGRRMFAGLGPNNAMFILAGSATLYCGVAVLFAKYGKSIRLRSNFAQHTLDSVGVRKVDLE
jgi:hypothetical protein